MGLYTVSCPQCHEQHTWFSGTADQRCKNCKENLTMKKNSFSTEQKLILSLEQTIAAKDQIIALLQNEVSRLKQDQALPKDSGLGQPINGPLNLYPGPRGPYPPYYDQLGLEASVSKLTVTLGDSLIPLENIQNKGTTNIESFNSHNHNVKGESILNNLDGTLIIK